MEIEYMSLIIDANCAHCVSLKNEHGAPILDYIFKGKIRLVTGGKHKREILLTKLGNLLQELLLSGSITEYSEENIVAKVAPLLSSLVSDDDHIVGLALESGARVLFTHDAMLEQDFTNEKVLGKPRGKIYKYKYHRHLLESICVK
ncbi:MAG: hypothetical protein EOS03_03065 [Mesorhizobium sp.]|uniref:hypothetical protein n=1 Tax=Mesorhizobium sp. TaxID=1871066 RepID=UPI000FE8AB6D|nr:hypothetical protein [Mesorhizobium sp.]RWN49455.1 MAG: hypothetical protein EOS03_03065 [Mesorhizobium sp.]